jgi:hypothetical protein
MKTTKNKYILFFSLVAITVIAIIKKAPKKMINQDNYFKKLVAFIKNKEGGLSNHPADAASKYPSPTPQKYHTNKGITFKTFVDSSKTLNFEPSAKNFLDMPDIIWLKIFKNKYYDRAKYTSNPILNGFIAYWFWQGWDTRLLPTKPVADILASSLSDKQKLTALVELRKKYYDTIVQKNPSQSVFKKGWHNTATEYFNAFAGDL